MSEYWEDVIAGAIYQHYKGEKYRVLHIAVHTETKQRLVNYCHVDHPAIVWARPYSMFIGDVEDQTLPTKRFIRISNE